MSMNECTCFDTPYVGCKFHGINPKQPTTNHNTKDYLHVPPPPPPLLDGAGKPAVNSPSPVNPPQGWQCPVCKAVFAPNFPCCMNCVGTRPK